MLLQIDPEFEHFLEFIITGVMYVLGWFASGAVAKYGKRLLEDSKALSEILKYL